MVSYPIPIWTYLYRHMIESRYPGYLHVSKNCCVLETGGDLAHYGLHAYQKGQYIKENICFLHGLLPLDDQPVIIPFIQFTTMQFADLHLLPGEIGDWVLLLDATKEAIQQQRAQQLAYQQS